MKNTLFNPRRVDIPKNLILIPQFWDKVYYKTLQDEALACGKLLESDFLIFEDYTMIVGFLGYPNIFTLLEFIKDLREKDIYFLGTAGSLNPAVDHPVPLLVEEIHSTEILDHFADETMFQMKCFEGGNLRRAKGVTVDIIQRETAPWLKKQVEKGMQFVEMEIFPLRVFLEKPFHAVVITSDLLKETGIEPFKDRRQLQKEFVKAFELIVNVFS